MLRLVLASSATALSSTDAIVLGVPANSMVQTVSDSIVLASHRARVEPEDQSGKENPTCLSGGCKQVGAKTPTCAGGDCDQTNADSPSCDGKSCVQTGAKNPTCSAGKCTQHKATRPTCEGGECEQLTADTPSCDGGRCNQAGSDKATCNGGRCNQSKVTGYATCKNDCDQRFSGRTYCGFRCLQSGSEQATCENHSCTQDDVSTLALCYGGRCSQKNSKGTVDCLGGNCDQTGTTGTVMCEGGRCKACTTDAECTGYRGGEEAAGWFKCIDSKCLRRDCSRKVLMFPGSTDGVDVDFSFVCDLDDDDTCMPNGKCSGATRLGGVIVAVAALFFL